MNTPWWANLIAIVFWTVVIRIIWVSLTRKRNINPDARMTRFRMWLTRQLEVMPDPGYAWCMNCSLNEGRTSIFMAESIRNHAEWEHRRGEEVRVLISWPAKGPVSE